MDLYKSDIYGECFIPSNFIELTSLIIKKEEDEDGNDFIPVWIWRGQSNIEWKTDSSGFRRIIGSEFPENDDTYLESYEERLLERATHQGYRLQDGRQLSDLELLAKLQHHGAATRLVDFSRNAFVGLWFAINSHPEKTGLLTGIHTSYIGGLEGILENNEYKKVIEECKKHNHPQVYESPVISSRIASQHAQFLYSSVSNDITGSLKLPDEKEAKMFIAISPEQKKEFKEILNSAFDFRTKTLFPDLDGFGMANHFTVDTSEMDRW